MNWKEKLNQRWIGGSVGAALAVLVSLAFGHQLESKSYDSLYARRGDKAVPEVVIVYLDDASWSALATEGGFVPRSHYARLLDRLTRDGAKAVVLDVLFTEPRPDRPEEDKQLVNAVRRNGKVIVCSEYGRADDPQMNGLQLRRPFEALRQAAAGWGVASLSQDNDGVNRRHHEHPDAPSLAWVAAKLVGAGSTASSESRLKERWFNYYSPPATLPNISFISALNANEISAERFRDKVVFVGGRVSASNAGDAKDTYPTPLNSAEHVQFSPGVEIHATAFLNLVRGDWLSRLPWVIEIVLLMAVGAALGYGLVLLQPLGATLVAVAAVAAAAAAAWMSTWFQHLWFPWLIIVAAQIPAAYSCSMVYNSLRLYVEKKRLQDSLALHLSPSRVKQILKQPDLLTPGAERQEISIMFTDIANFSKISARMEPGDLFKMLNNYYEKALACVHKSDGTVIKLIGDSIFAIWNAPFIQPDQQERAIRAALLLQESVVQFEETHHSLPMRTRIGLHTGDAYVGNVGSTQRFDYTAIGESINLASRLEGLNKHLGTEILATRDIQKLVEKTIISRKVGYFRFKGLDRITEVHEIIGGMEKADATKAWRDTFEAGLFHFTRKNFDAAEAAFKHVLEMKPVDGASEFYLERIAEFRSSPPAEDWAGEIEMKEK